MGQVVVKRICPQCAGDGVFGQTAGAGGQGPHPCDWAGCAGTGYIELGFVELDPDLSDILAKVEDVLDKCNDILEALQT